MMILVSWSAHKQRGAARGLALLLVFSSICVGWYLLTHDALGTAAVGQTAHRAEVEVPVSPLMAARYVAGIAGETALRLAGTRLQDVTIGGRRYAAGDDFPTFVVLDRSGQQLTVGAADQRWRVEVSAGEAPATATYSANGLSVQVNFLADADRLHVIVRVMSEGDWKLIAVGGTILNRAVLASSREDYLLDGAGRLVFPDVPQAIERKWNAQYDYIAAGEGVLGAAFIGWREQDRIVVVKPLTFSHWLAWSVTPRGNRTTMALKTGLYFRPPDTRLFETKLCHQALAIRMETAGDINGDRQVDWVDAGIAYRERYPKPIRTSEVRQRLRDAFRVYYAVHTFRSYEAAFAGLSEIDFADGIWWLKGMMEPASWQDFESHKFTVQPNAKLSRLEPWKQRMTAAHQWIGPYYGHDYISLDAGDWPDSFIKRNPRNQPFAYGKQKYYKDNVRLVATGEVFRHYEQILKACLLQRGDPIMLDTFTAYARPGYHPDYPTTAEVESQAKHRIASFLRDEKGLILAAEGAIEGVQDVVDYSAVTFQATGAVEKRIWEKRTGILRVPMLPAVFQGATYNGAGWYELRNPDPNWAIGLVYGVGYWDWLPQGPQYAWMRFARYYFNQNLIWAQVADAKVSDVQQDDAQYTISYDNGATLWADVAANRWRLNKDGVRYDGFTPFNNRGYMAVLAQGEFEITISGEHRLEISPQQPFREQITFESRSGNGQTVLRGRFGHHKWRIPIVKTTSDKKETTRGYEADPVLVLRKVG
jgi:hypothetical protein